MAEPSRGMDSNSVGDHLDSSSFDMAPLGFLWLGAVSSFSITHDGEQMCIRFPSPVPSIHIDFQDRSESICAGNHLEPEDTFIEFLPPGTAPYGDLVRQLDLRSHGTVNVWKVGEHGYFLATAREFNWVVEGEAAVSIPAPSRPEAIADFLAFTNLSWFPQGGFFGIPTNSGMVVVDIAGGFARRVELDALKSPKNLCYSSYLDGFIALESGGLGVSFWSGNGLSGSVIVQEICNQLSRALPDLTWPVSCGVPKSIVTSDEASSGIVTSVFSTGLPIRISLETGTEEAWFGQNVEDLSRNTSAEVFLASGGYESGLVRKISFAGDLLQEMRFGESPRIRVCNMSGGHALLSDGPGTVAKLRVSDMVLLHTNDLKLSSITCVAETASGNLVLGGFEGDQFLLLQIEPEGLTVTDSKSFSKGSHLAFLLTDKASEKIILCPGDAPELLVWSGDISGNPDIVRLPATPRIGVIGSSSQFLYLAYRDTMSIGVVNLRNLQPERLISAPAKILALEITPDGKKLLALGSGATDNNYLSVIAV